MDKYRIDSHKLIYHVALVNKWLRGKFIYPIYCEIGPSGTCNHRCTYCGLDFMEYQPRFLDTVLLKKRITELGTLGIKSIMYGGEGEPLLHKDIIEIINHTKISGIDVAITTNGVLFKKEIASAVLGNVEWIKIGIDAADRETYAKIHRCNPNDFDKVIKNLLFAVKLKDKNNYKCTLGIQLLLLPENHQEVIKLAKIARDIGVNYLVVKPYSQHPQSRSSKYSTVKYGENEYLEDKLQKFKTKKFEVIFRMHTMEKWDKKLRKYNRCHALPFWTHIDAGGNVWGCGVFITDKRFFYGNIYNSSFQKILHGKERMRFLSWAETEFDASKCRVNCRMDEINRYLWDLKNPPEHVNFI